MPAGGEAEQRKPEREEKEQAAEARSPSWGHRHLLQVSSLLCRLQVIPCLSGLALKGQAALPHFSFFSSRFDADASVDSSLDSVTAAGSLGLDSS